MVTFRTSTLTLLVILSSFTLAQWGSAQTQDRWALRSLESRFGAALASSRASAVAELFTAGGWFSPFDGAAVGGQERLRELFAAQESPSGGSRIRIWPREYAVSGDLAYGHGTYRLVAPGGPVIAEGNYLGVYRRVGGEWRIHRYMGNARVPRQE